MTMLNVVNSIVKDRYKVNFVHVHPDIRTYETPTLQRL